MNTIPLVIPPLNENEIQQL